MSSSCSLSSLDKFLFKMNEDSVESTPVVSEAQTDSSCEPILKRCANCQLEFSLDEFCKSGKTKDGLHSCCKACLTNYSRNRKRPRDETDPCDESCEVGPEPIEELDSLYIVENPRVHGEIKIGRSQSPEDRAKQLSAGHNFRLIVKYSYGGKGFLEKTLHNKLKHLRVEIGAGVEWFRVTAEQADLLIRATILEHELSTTL